MSAVSQNRAAIQSLEIPDDMPPRDAVRFIARNLNGMIGSGELRRLPRITLARLRVIQMEIERLCTREEDILSLDDWRVRRGVWWRLRRWWRTGR